MVEKDLASFCMRFFMAGKASAAPGIALAGRRVPFEIIMLRFGRDDKPGI